MSLQLSKTASSPPSPTSSPAPSVQPPSQPPLSSPQPADVPVIASPSSTDDHADMSATATLYMQDLDMADVENRSSSLMARAASAGSHNIMPVPINIPRPSSIPLDVLTPPTDGSWQQIPRQPAGPTLAKPNTRPDQHQISQDNCDNQVRSNATYCYRHRPDARTGRQAEDISLDQVRKDSEKEMSMLPESARDGIQNVWSLFTTAPAKQRELMLRGILATCCFPQLSYVSASVREQLKIDFLSALPPELGLRTLCFLDAKSLCQASQVSHTWRNLADDDVIWHRMCEQHIDRKCTTCGWGLPLLRKRKAPTEASPQDSVRHVQQTLPLPTTHTTSAISHDEIHQYPDSASDDGEPASAQKQPGGRKRTAAAVIPPHPITVKKSCTPYRNYDGAESYFKLAQPASIRPWKEVYRDRFVIGTNWKHGRCTTQILKGHTGEVTCLQFDEEVIATGSYDRTIKIWSIETGEELRTLTGHTMGVKCLQFDKSKLVSGSLDGTLKMWDLKNGKVIRTFPGHSGAVVSVHFDGSILASGSQDRTIRVRDFANCSRVSLRGHTDYVNSVRVDAASKTLFSASDDCTVRVWDLQAKRCVRVLRGHSLQVTQVLPMPCGFEFPNSDGMDDDGSNNSSLSSGSPVTRVVAVPVADPRAYDQSRCPPKYVLTCSMDSTVRLWEVSTGRCLRTFFGHMEGIWAVAADSLRMVSGSNDGAVKLWDPRTGIKERSYSDHKSPVTCVGLSDRRMVTGSEDKEVRIYNFGA